MQLSVMLNSSFRHIEILIILATEGRLASQKYFLVSFHFYWMEMEFCLISSRFLQAFRCSQASVSNYSKTALAKSTPLHTPACHRYLIANIGIFQRYIELKIFIHPILSRCLIRQTIACSFLLSKRKNQLETFNGKMVKDNQW